MGHKILERYKMIMKLAVRDFKSKYIGSYLGIVWAFIQPAITILIYWFIFQVGFKSVPVDNVPFLLWFLAGMIPWLFFSESISSATYSFMDSSFLVKKIVFPISILPVAKIVSSMFVHIFFIAVLFILFKLYNYPFSIYNLQFIYYSFCTFFFLVGLSWITSTLVVFFKDIGQLINMLLQFFFWLTPIFWSLNMLPSQYVFVFKLNPLFYLVEGYRDSFITKKWFWEHTSLTPYFLFLMFTILGSGFLLYKKLKPHFADVL